MRIALLGAGGFIGSNLVEHLIDEDRHDVIGIDTSDDKLAGIDGARFSFHKADIRYDHDVIESVVAESDVVVDLVAYARPYRRQIWLASAFSVLSHGKPSPSRPKWPWYEVAR